MASMHWWLAFAVQLTKHEHAPLAVVLAAAAVVAAASAVAVHVGREFAIGFVPVQPGQVVAFVAVSFAAALAVAAVAAANCAHVTPPLRCEQRRSSPRSWQRWRCWTDWMHQKCQQVLGAPVVRRIASEEPAQRRQRPKRPQQRRPVNVALERMLVAVANVVARRAPVRCWKTAS